jgi:short-subunit dehydrogenase
MRDWSYRGRWALVTGASAGLGEEFARQLAGRGMNLVLAARREERLEQLAEELRQAHGVSAVALATDLSVAGEGGRLWARARVGRTIHLLVNNAGFGAQGRFDEIDLERQTEMVQVDCVALLELAHHALHDFRGMGDGGIINVASLAAFQPLPRLATYAAAKAFVLSLSEALWVENRDAGVRVVAVCPGRTPTEFQAVAGTGSTKGAFGLRSPEAVVGEGLAAFEKGKSYVVPGMENHLASVLVRLLPRSAVTRALKGLVQRRAARAVGEE